MEAMRDHGFYVQAALEHDGHLVPGLIHLAAVDAFDSQHVENDFVPIDGNRFGRNTEHRDLSAVTHVIDHVAKSRWAAGHFQGDVKAFFHAELLSRISK